MEFQAATIFMESYCDFIIFFEQGIDDLNEAQILVIRDIINGGYIRPSSMKEQVKLIEKCVEKNNVMRM